MNGIVVGIDLGTTNSAVAVKRLETEVLSNEKEEKLIPSCVYVRESSSGLKNAIVGRSALNWQKQEPEATISHIKRLMGRDFSDQNVQDIINDNSTGHEIRQGCSDSGESLVVAIPSKEKKGESFEFSPEEISSVILGHLKENAIKELNSPVDKAVVTVPAYFNDKQRHATLVAARLAGFSNTHLLPEPSAAAIAFGIEDLKGTSLKTIVVFDFGGGTLDISILTLGKDRIIEQGKKGDLWLGGKDIDKALADFILKKAQEEDSLLKLDHLMETMPREKSLRAAMEMENLAETAKIELGRRESTEVIVSGIFENNGFPVDFTTTLTSDDLHFATKSFVQRAMDLLSNLLDDISFSMDEIDNVLLVGGSSQLGPVRKRIEEMFGAEKVLLHSRPMLAVVEGAAVYSQFKLNPDFCSNGQVFLKDVLFTSAHDYYLKIPGQSSPMLLVEKNTPLPFSKKVNIQLQSNEQKLLHLQFLNLVNDIYEGVGRLWIPLDFSDSLDEDKEPPILILTVDIDENNLVSVDVRPKNIPGHRFQHNISRGKADEQLYLHLEKSITAANKIKDKWAKIEYEERSLVIVDDINRILDEGTENIDVKMQKRAEQRLKTADELLEEKEAVSANIRYMEYLCDHCRRNTPAENLSHLANLEMEIKEIKKINWDADAYELIDRTDKLFNSFKKHFPKESAQCSFMQTMDQGREMGMHEEIDEIMRLTNEQSEDRHDRIRDLLNQIHNKDSTRDYSINTDFTLS